MNPFFETNKLQSYFLRLILLESKIKTDLQSQTLAESVKSLKGSLKFIEKAKDPLLKKLAI